MQLGYALQRNNNNLDLIRLIAAAMVIYGHANTMVPEALKGGDFVARWLHFDYSGSLAVNTFFFISGLVVTNSLLEKKSLYQFTLARMFRIYPAMLAVLLIMAYLIGPALTQLPLSSYLSDPATLSYVLKGIAMNIQYNLPGVFLDHNTSAVNGSLWTIPYEVKAYALIAALFALKVHRLRWLSLLLFACVCIDPLLESRILFSWRSANSSIDPLLPCFAMGALAAILKEHIRIKLYPLIGFALLFWLFNQASFSHYIFYALLFSSILYISTRPWMLALRLPADISYGVYLWGWPVQQLTAHWWPELGAQPHRLIAIIGACLCGVLSWYLLEQPAINGGRRFYAWSSQRLRLLR